MDKAILKSLAEHIDDVMHNFESYDSDDDVDEKLEAALDVLRKKMG